MICNKRKCCLIDATFREGLQAPMVDFSLEDVLAISKLIVRSGAEMLEVGHPFISANAMRHTRSVVDLNLGVPILAHARANQKDIYAVYESGASWVGIFVGINKISEKSRLNGRSFDEILDIIYKSVRFAKSLGLSVRFTVEDSSRTSWERMNKALEVAVSAKCDRICFADSVGIMEPKKVGSIISKIKTTFPNIDVEVHFHNDRGLAMANSLSAVDAGADWISVSVNGLGERCGITDHAILAANLYFSGIRDHTQIAARAASDASLLVSRCSGQIMSKSYPVLGEYAFTHTARLHVLALEKDMHSYEWIDPNHFNRTHQKAAIDQSIISRSKKIGQ